MCGIFGVLVRENSEFKPSLIKSTTGRLFKLSESRGKEASGLALLSENKINVYKIPVPASKLIKNKQYKKLFNKLPRAVLGHARLVTDGDLEFNQNNQPVMKNGLVGIHNGIVVNGQELWSQFNSLKKAYQVDTEIIIDLMKMFLQKGNSLINAAQKVFKLIKGSASIALLFNNFNYLLLATNTGSIYHCFNNKKNLYLFASEEYILRTLLKKKCQIEQIKANTGCLIDLNNLAIKKFPLSRQEKTDRQLIEQKASFEINDLSDYQKQLTQERFPDVEPLLSNNRFPQEALSAIKSLKRCSRCILPETMPFIKFDEQGVCNYCQSDKKIKVKGEGELERVVARYRDKNDRINCLVAFSGGRDSSYGLHYIKNVLKLNPVAYSYDWGMITDLARRNQARISGQLGIKHILISADIKKKRENIKKNVLAWLKRPDLGIVPLFMAGDKQYFYYANKLKRRLGIDLTIYCENPLERTDFKTGFCRIKPGSISQHIFTLSLLNKLKLFFYYAKQFTLNPAYLNSSLLDSLSGYLASYLIPHNYLFLYQYINWDEKKINSTLLDEYDWETALDSKSTWRIGDGTASFYNYIYYLRAGFTENDTFRSNQIRNGLISRSEALKLVEQENQPRYDSIKWYCQTIGIDFNKTLRAINKMPRLY